VAGTDARTREHLANQRTLLAWIRTSIAMMGLGFVVARFALFLRQLEAENGVALSPSPGTSAGIGIALVAGGVLAGILGAIRFWRTREQIERGKFEPDALVEVILLAMVIGAGVAMTIYLAANS
jgi:putative membrane protein